MRAKYEITNSRKTRQSTCPIDNRSIVPFFLIILIFVVAKIILFIIIDSLSFCHVQSSGTLFHLILTENL